MKSAGKAHDTGKRRQGREMALQMLFQWEASGSHPSEVLRAFDIFLYGTETAGGQELREGSDPVANSLSKEAAVVAVDPPGSPTKSAAEPDEPDSITQRREAAKQENLERQISIDVGAKAQSKPYQFARSLVLGVTGHQDDLDARIAAGADNWRIERMPQVDRNILRLALFEFLHQAELPKAVIIDEAIELAKKFGGENSGAFVNGLLDGLLRAPKQPLEHQDDAAAPG